MPAGMIKNLFVPSLASLPAGQQDPEEQGNLLHAVAPAMENGGLSQNFCSSFGRKFGAN